MTNDSPIRSALFETIVGLSNIIKTIPNESDTSKTSIYNVRWMIEQLTEHLEDWPTDKISRWIGFIQGVGAVKGWLDVDKERNRTRPLFHKAYSEMGISIPLTQG